MFDERWLPDVDSHHDDPFNRRACYFHIIRECGAPGRILACIVPIRSRVPDTFGHRSIDEMVARLGAAPSVSSSQARRIAVFLARVTIVSF